MSSVILDLSLILTVFLWHLALYPIGRISCHHNEVIELCTHHTSKVKTPSRLTPTNCQNSSDCFHAFMVSLAVKLAYGTCRLSAVCSAPLRSRLQSSVALYRILKPQQGSCLQYAPHYCSCNSAGSSCCWGSHGQSDQGLRICQEQKQY